MTNNNATKPSIIKQRC